MASSELANAGLGYWTLPRPAWETVSPGLMSEEETMTEDVAK